MLFRLVHCKANFDGHVISWPADLDELRRSAAEAKNLVMCIGNLMFTKNEILRCAPWPAVRTGRMTCIKTCLTVYQARVYFRYVNNSIRCA